MSIWTIAEIDARIADWKLALTKASRGQTIRVGGVELTRPSDERIWATLHELERERKALSGQAGPVCVSCIPCRRGR